MSGNQKITNVCGWMYEMEKLMSTVKLQENNSHKT